MKLFNFVKTITILMCKQISSKITDKVISYILCILIKMYTNT